MLQVSSGPVNFDFSEVVTTPSDKLQRVKKGDMLVAVAAGTKPWTAETPTLTLTALSLFSLLQSNTKTSSNPNPNPNRRSKFVLTLTLIAGSKPWTAEGGWNTDIKVHSAVYVPGRESLLSHRIVHCQPIALLGEHGATLP